MKVYRQIHRWLGLVVVVQALIWSLSGLVMTLLPVELVSGETVLQSPSSRPLSADETAAVPLILEQVSRVEQLHSFRTKQVGDAMQLVVTNASGAEKRYALPGGETVEIDEDYIRQRSADLLGEDVEILFVSLIAEPGREFTGPLPAWKVIADNSARSHLYFALESGELLAHRTSFWRWHRYSYDLHTFNFSGASTVNNPLLSLFAVLMLAVTISGLALLILILLKRIRNHDASVNPTSQ